MDKDLAAAPKQQLPEPVAWMHDGYVSTNKERVLYYEQKNRNCGFKARPVHALYTADQLRTAIAAERERNPWRMAIDDALVTAHLGVATDDPYDDLNLLLDWHHDIWLDPAVSSDAQALIDRGAAASEAELSTLRQHLAEAVRERDALRSVVQSALNNNGGPIDADSTLDGKSYVMVLREDFDAIDAASRVAGI